MGAFKDEYLYTVWDTPLRKVLTISLLLSLIIGAGLFGASFGSEECWSGKDVNNGECEAIITPAACQQCRASGGNCLNTGLVCSDYGPNRSLMYPGVVLFLAAAILLTFQSCCACCSMETEDPPPPMSPDQSVMSISSIQT